MHRNSFTSPATAATASSSSECAHAATLATLCSRPSHRPPSPQDVEEITVADLSRAICVAAGGAATVAHRPPEPGMPRRFRRMLMVADTCQAASLLQATQACDGVAGVASSLVGENSYSTNSDSEVGGWLGGG